MRRRSPPIAAGGGKAVRLAVDLAQPEVPAILGRAPREEEGEEEEEEDGDDDKDDEDDEDDEDGEDDADGEDGEDGDEDEDEEGEDEDDDEYCCRCYLPIKLESAREKKRRQLQMKRDCVHLSERQR